MYVNEKVKRRNLVENRAYILKKAKHKMVRCERHERTEGFEGSGWDSKER